jgi:hypothetical protein
VDIESKAYRVRDALAGPGIEVSSKASGRLVLVARSELPSNHALGMMHEREFDKICAAALGDSQ